MTNRGPLIAGAVFGTALGGLATATMKGMFRAYPPGFEVALLPAGVVGMLASGNVHDMNFPVFILAAALQWALIAGVLTKVKRVVAARWASHGE